MAEPVVHQGARGADARGMFRQGAGMPTIHVPDVPAARQGEAVFISTSDTFRITLWERWDRSFIDKRGNRKPEKRSAQFVRGVYRTTDTEEIEALRNCSSYGVYFYELEQLQQQAREAKMSAALAAADDPEIAEALKVKLGAQEMPLPKRDSESVPTKEPERVKPIK